MIDAHIIYTEEN